MEKTILKECKKHGLTEYTLLSDGYYHCKKCMVDAVQRRRDKVKKILVDYKGGKCEICGYNKCISALEFHHLDPNRKDFGIGQKGYCRSIEKSKKEVDKCILVCANCHREIHANEKEDIHQKIKKEIDKNVVLNLLQQKKTQKEIAQTIGVSLSTLKRYIAKLRECGAVVAQ